MAEEWRDAVDYEGRYLVSSLGRVASLVCSRGRRSRPFVLRQKTDKDGYRAVALTDEHGVMRHFLAHALVCAAFNGPRPEGYVCRHLDGSRDRNVPDNLAWGTPKDNKADSIAHGTAIRGERSGRRKLSEEQVRAIRVAHGTQASIAAQFGVSPGCVQRIFARTTWAHLGVEQ